MSNDSSDYGKGCFACVELVDDMKIASVCVCLCVCMSISPVLIIARAQSPKEKDPKEIHHDEHVYYGTYR